MDEGHRLDLTHHQVVTIDDASTTEVDDGLSAEFLDDGRVRLWIHVADPTRWVRPEDPLDREARRRGSTMYLPTGALQPPPAPSLSLLIGGFSYLWRSVLSSFSVTGAYESGEGVLSCLVKAMPRRRVGCTLLQQMVPC